MSAPSGDLATGPSAGTGHASSARTPAPLGSRLPSPGAAGGDDLLDRFLDWVAELGFELFPAQEEALLEIMAGRHVILSTPTGSGKSLVAAGLHFETVARGGVSYYTSPIKALASEKFFDLSRTFGADRVGMLTGDASINPEAPIVCCTAEVLSNLALRYGDRLEVDSVVMDEFHYYSDPERGVAWQVPLITLPRTRFLLMSATLGNPAPIKERLERFTGREVATVVGLERPVPLSFEYSELPIHETIEKLVGTRQSPVYVVNFTQRECAELATALTSHQLTDKEQKAAIREAIGDFRFDTAYGKEMRRFLGHGIGVHHAGLLPKYRLLVEQLSQRGLLQVICGTDTLGVGVNVPIRTVLFKKLCKFDGHKVTILSVRDFHQISGRAGRKGFDDRGTVVCQAPEHVTLNLRIDQKIAADPKKAKKLRKLKPPEKGYVHWDEATFRKLIDSPPETLESRFQVTHGMILDLIQRDAADDDPTHDNFFSLRALIRECHETPERKRELTHDAAQRVRSLHRAGILKLRRDVATGYRWVVLDENLQLTFSLYQTLALYLVETLSELDPLDEGYAEHVLSLVEAVLENPDLILRRQADKARDELYHALKAERVEYDQRQARLEEVTWPKPDAEAIYRTFNLFREKHPWVAGETVKPKGIGRELWESYLGFGDFVRHYGIQRSEGLLLRYLSQLYKTLAQSVPDELKTDEVWDMLGFFRAMLSRVDTSLIEEWESLLHPESGAGRIAGTDEGRHALEEYELLVDRRAFAARLRGELFQLVRALAQRDWEEAVACVHPECGWSEERFSEAMAPYFEQYEELVFTPEARRSDLTRLQENSPGRWEIVHTLLDPEGDRFWFLEARVELDLGDVAALVESGELKRPLLRVGRIAS
jgi:superfamily II DNA/RNA helicase